MATNVYLREQISDINPGSNDERAALLVRGTVATSHVTNTVLGPTAGIQITAAAAGTIIEWHTPPLVGVTISGTITPNLRMLESAIAANAGAQLTIEREDIEGNFISTVCDSEFGTEITTSEAAQSWPITPTSTTLADGNRLRIMVKINDAGGTMAASKTVTTFVDGPTAAASGDSYVTFTETIALFQVIGARDTFTRTVASGFGTSDFGGPWTKNGGTASNYSTTGTVARQSQAAVSTSMHTVLPEVYVGDTEVLVGLLTDKLAVGGSQTATVGVRFMNHQNYYRLLVTFATTAAVSLAGETVIASTVTNVVGSTTVARETHAAGRKFWVKFQVQQLTPTTEQWRGKIWQDTTAEPTAWDMSGATASSPLVAGGISLRSFLSGTVSNFPVAYDWDDLQAGPIFTPYTSPYPQLLPQ